MSVGVDPSARAEGREGSSSLADPARRGRVVLSDRVVQKIASQAASEVSAAGGRSGGFLGIGAEADFSARPETDVTLSGRSVSLAIRLGVVYPTSIREATETVRRHVTERVESLTGLTVRRIDVTVAWLTPATADQPTGRRLL